MVRRIAYLPFCILILVLALQVSLHAGNGNTRVLACILAGDGFNFAQREQISLSVEKMATGLREGWEVDELHLLSASALSYDEFGLRLEEIVGSADENDIVIFYYMGHGDNDEMWPYFNDPNGMPYYSYSNLDGLLSGRARHTVVILDACHAGGAANYLSREKWIMASCATSKDNLQPPDGPAFFTAALADAMLNGKCGVRETFDAAGHTWNALMRDFWEATLGTAWYLLQGETKLRSENPHLFYPQEEDLIVNRETQSIDPCTGFILEISSALFDFWSTDEALMAQYRKAAFAKSQSEGEMACRQVINLNRELAEKAEAVVQALRTAGYASLAETVRQAKDEFTASPYTAHAEEWIKGNIQLGNKLLGQRGTALGVLFDSMHKVENEMCIRCPSFEIHPWSH